MSHYNSKSTSSVKSENVDPSLLMTCASTPPATKMEVLLSGTAQCQNLPMLMSPTEAHWSLAVIYVYTVLMGLFNLDRPPSI